MRITHLLVRLFGSLMLIYCTATPVVYAMPPEKPHVDLTMPISSPGKMYIIVEPLKNKLTLYIENAPYRSYPIALGKQETPTPVGEYFIMNKYKNWAVWFGTRWMGLNVPWGIYGIHGTNRPHSIGQDASHGCIRMLNKHVEELFELVQIGTKVTILGHVLGEPDQEPRRLAKGDRGADVQLIQNRLRAMGFFHGPCNGRFEELTNIAVKKLEQSLNLPIDGVVGMKEYEALGLYD